jgi:hypothetical protein
VVPARGQQAGLVVLAAPLALAPATPRDHAFILAQLSANSKKRTRKWKRNECCPSLADERKTFFRLMVQSSDYCQRRVAFLSSFVREPRSLKV